MSMNFSEFKKLIGADPRNRERGTDEARKSTPEFETAAREAELFEDKLEAALHIPPAAGLLDDIKTISQQGSARRTWVPMALAASLILAVSAVWMVRSQTPHWDSVEDYLADHYSRDGASLVAQAVAPIDKADIDHILASLNAAANSQLAARIRFIKFCPTPDGRGAHMVIDTAQGLVTVILMPHTVVPDGELIEFQDMQALLVSLGPGSAAIIGGQDQAFDSLQTMLRHSLSTNTIGV